MVAFSFCAIHGSSAAPTGVPGGTIRRHLRNWVASLHPDYIYLTHLHWDHFQSASLKLFPFSTPILVPKGHYRRMKTDLNGIGFQNVTELNHGESVELGQDFKLTSYSFDLCCDSAVVIEGSGATLLNLNDCKIMGWPLRHLLSRHDRPDFAFCSHSSANSRACFEVTDEPNVAVDDLETYLDRFYQFVTSCRARYAVPFASNQCYLHKDTFGFNGDNRTPMMVKEYWERYEISEPELKVMVSGDSWSTENGFEIGEKDWFSDRERLLREYQIENERKLEDFYAKEEKASVTMRQMQRFFKPFIRAIPYPLRRWYKGHPIVYVFTAGDNKFVYHVDIYRNEIRTLDPNEYDQYPLQIHVSAYVMRHAMAMNMVADIGIGKRIKFRVTGNERRYAERLISLMGLYHYELIPLRRNFRPRSLKTWLQRWREVLLFSQLLFQKLRGKELTFERQLTSLPPKRNRASSKPQPELQSASAEG